MGGHCSCIGQTRYVVFGRDTPRPFPASPVRPSSAADRHSYPHGIATASTNAQEIRLNFFLSIDKSKVGRLFEEEPFDGLMV